MAGKRSATNKVPNRGGMAFGRNLMVLAGLIFALGAYGTVQGALTLGWPRADATVITADLARQIMTTRDPDGRSREESWNIFPLSMSPSLSPSESRSSFRESTGAWPLTVSHHRSLRFTQ
jgi:hypothetical protein